MNAYTENRLIEEALSLVEEKRFNLVQEIGSRSNDIYSSSSRFDLEADRVISVLPHAMAHVSEIPRPFDFLTRQIAGHSLLITRNGEGQVQAFRNVCRHRGMELVDQAKGCKRRFTCPYHAWTYDVEGELVSAPHFHEGFPQLDKGTLGLVKLPTLELGGFVWSCLSTETTAEHIEESLALLEGDLNWLDLPDLEVAAETTLDIHANWKLLVEGGLEAYHFKVAHRDTIAPYFNDNQSTYELLGDHIRSVLMRTSFAKLAATAKPEWRLRDHANLLYTLLPTSQLLVQQDHVVWIKSTPAAADRTQLRLVTLAENPDSQREHWNKNHAITEATLKEDFEIAEGIQRGLSARHPQTFYFGRYEGALTAFNELVERYLAEQPA